MDRVKITSEFKKIVAFRYGLDEKQILETSTFDELKLDSLDQIELVMEAEKAFAFDAKSEYLDIKTVGQAIDFIFLKKN